MDTPCLPALRIFDGPTDRDTVRCHTRSSFAFAAAGYANGMAKDHGSSVKNDKQYEGLRKKGMSKSRATAISNSPGSSSRGGKKSGGGGGSSRSRKSSGSGSGGNRAQKAAAGRKGGKASS